MKFKNFGVQVNGEFSPKTEQESVGRELRYSSTLLSLWLLDMVGGQHHVLAALTPGERPSTHCIGG